MKLISNKEFSGNAVVGWFILTILLIFLARSVYTSHPELGGDARKKWNTAVVLAETSDTGVLFEHAHHSIRWGVVLPVAVGHTWPKGLIVLRERLARRFPPMFQRRSEQQHALPSSVLDKVHQESQ